MEKMCSICGKTNKSNYKDYCKCCYQKQWVTQLNEKPCLTCGKSFKQAGQICNSCKRYDSIEKKGNTSCSRCGRNNVLIHRFSDMLCGKCLRNKNDAEIPGHKENRIKINRKFCRKYRGWDENKLDLPPKEKQPTWKTRDGYVMMYDKNHMNSNVNGCIQEHVYVMSKYLKRPLFKGENVHHKNGLRDDNRIENLELWNKSQPCGQRVNEKLQWAKEFLESYGFKVVEDHLITI